MTPAAMFVLLLLGHELIDTRELRYEPPNLAARIAKLRNAPPVSDTLLFTVQKHEANAAITANREVRAAVLRLAELYPRRDFSAALASFHGVTTHGTHCEMLSASTTSPRSAATH